MKLSRSSNITSRFLADLASTVHQYICLVSYSHTVSLTLYYFFAQCFNYSTRDPDTLILKCERVQRKLCPGKDMFIWGKVTKVTSEHTFLSSLEIKTVLIDTDSYTRSAASGDDKEAWEINTHSPAITISHYCSRTHCSFPE